MKVFAHYYQSEETGNNYRWRTILQFGTSWDIIGSVVMKNPGSAEPNNSVYEPSTLEQLKRFSESEYDWYSLVWYSFSSDDTLQKVEKLFCAYYKTSTLNGVIQVFNLMNVRDPNLEQALIKDNKVTYPFSKMVESDIKSLVAPVYLGWGDLWTKEPFREDAEKIFRIVQEQMNGNLDVLTSEDNVETALAILANAGEIHNRIRENFIEEIHKLCVSYGYTFKCDEGVRTASHNNWIHITDPKIIDVEFRIGVKSHTNSDGYRMCFVSLTRQKPNCEYKFWQNENPTDDEFPFGWTYLWGEDGETGRWWRWDDIDTLKDMANGKMLKFIERQLQQIKDENIFEKMNELLG